MSREGKSQGGYPGRDDERNLEDRSESKRSNIQKRNHRNVYGDEHGLKDVAPGKTGGKREKIHDLR
jgi:hypothetical protein